MRSNEQFKALVYSKAEKASAENKKKRAIMMRGISTLSLVAIIGVAFLYSTNRNKVQENMNDACAVRNYQNESIMYAAGKTAEEGVLVADAAYFSMDDSLEVETYNEVIAEDSVEKFSYKSDSFSFSDKKFEEQNQAGDIVELAKTMCTVDYDSYKVYFDDESEVWKIVFYKTDVAGGDQCVYLDSNGKLKMIVYGE